MRAASWQSHHKIGRIYSLFYGARPMNVPAAGFVAAFKTPV
ncbi:hypothetical protein HMPREF0731_0572 [Pseudoroseomonas cervicalis ATCC 49957]|uniref:Uncharacterized protein n=1 Tax=Pseudoroseomonas cervicalis ATCC 49957 TaxID=525371 RepID=D5RHL3_9PROT|nr:hypothetical protein HMPREF0731_0572 [Pseudoroseomonas cervicalis ATCC 49957]